MLRLIARGIALSILILFLVPAAFSKNPAGNSGTDPEKKAGDVSTVVASPDTTASSDPVRGDESASPDATPPVVPASPAQDATSGKKSTTSDEYKPAPIFTPTLATTGTLGMFTLETADTLPKGGFAVSAFGNKFGRMPGSVTILEIGVDLSYGITDTLNAYAAFDPYGHVHVGCPGQLSLRAIPVTPNCGPLAAPVPNSVFPVASGSSAAYVEDYPFASNNNGGIGNLTLGLKYALMSERHGAPISFSVRNDLIISTRTDENKLLNNGTQASPLSDMVSLAVSKQWSDLITGTFNFGYMFVRAPRDGQGNILIAMPDQLRTGVGIQLLPESRFQPMMEYSGVVFVSAPGTPEDMSFGARDPIDGIWGVRMYPWKSIGIDVGYRLMLNLRNSSDRNRSGFVVKVGGTYWPKKEPPVNHPPTISCAEDKSMVYFGSNDAVAITCTASDPDNDPLTYTWSSTCGKVDGDGAMVRWLSAGVPVGSCTITSKVDDGRGGSASSSVSVSVETKPNHPPTITCSADRSSVFAGEKVHITTNASDPDGDPLTYTWRANAGQIAGSGATADFDTTGLAPGNYTITVRVDDGRGGAADCSSMVEVKAVPPPPQASKISDCAFGKELSTRIDNVCKRILDDVALRLQNEPRASAVIIGYSEPKESKKPEKIAGDRGTNAVKYLGEKGIDPSRVTTRTGAGQAGAKDNRRIDVIWVPEGATY